MRFVAQEQELGPELPNVFGNADYAEYRAQMEQIDELLIRSGVERRFVEQRLEEWKRAGGRVGLKAQLRHQKLCSQALRCGIARQLTEREYRGFARRIAESPLLQRFCRMERREGVRVPAKSTLERYDKLAPEGEIRNLVSLLLGMAAGERHEDLGLETEVGVEALLADTTCLKANIHFPTDGVLLRDMVRTLMKAVKLIRREGLKHRMEEPQTFISRP